MRRLWAGILAPDALSNSTVSSSRIRPRSGVIRPAIMLTTDVLPAPEGPNKAVAPLCASKRAAREKSPSCFSTSTDSMSLSVETRASAAGEPFGGDERHQRDYDGDDNKPARGAFAAGYLHEGIDGRGDGLGFAGN